MQIYYVQVGVITTLVGLPSCLLLFQFYTYDPSSDVARKETLNVNRALMKR